MPTSCTHRIRSVAYASAIDGDGQTHTFSLSGCVDCDGANTWVRLATPTPDPPPPASDAFEEDES